MYKFKIKIPKELDIYIKSQIESQIDKGLNDVADWIGTEADRILRQEYPDGAFDTGFLAGSLVVDKEEFLKKEIGYSANYGIYIEMGTDPHRPPIKNIYDWCWRKRKDLDIKITSDKTVKLKDGNTYNIQLLRVTMAIIKNIEKHGTNAHPFLRPAFYQGITKTKEFLTENFK